MFYDPEEQEEELAWIRPRISLTRYRYSTTKEEYRFDMGLEKLGNIANSNSLQIPICNRMY